MIDNDDIAWTALLFSGGSGWIGAVLFIVAVSVTSYIACENGKECSAKSCPNGKAPRLMDHECLCAEVAK